MIAADALHTQTSHARYLHGRGVYYVLSVKGNQPKLQDELVEIPWRQVPTGNRNVETKNGHRMIRTINCVSVSTGISFPHATQALQVTRKSRAKDLRKWRKVTAHVLTSLLTLLAVPADIGELIRGRWGVAHGLPWRRDVTLNEAKSQAGKGNAPQLMAILRNIAITLLKQP